jgi:hypothetical protein
MNSQEYIQISRPVLMNCVDSVDSFRDFTRQRLLGAMKREELSVEELADITSQDLQYCRDIFEGMRSVDSLFFSLASLPLNLTVEDVIPLRTDLRPKDYEGVLRDIYGQDGYEPGTHCAPRSGLSLVLFNSIIPFGDGSQFREIAA